MESISLGHKVIDSFGQNVQRYLFLCKNYFSYKTAWSKICFVFSEVTLSALNAPEGDVDIEGLGESHSATKKLDFDSGMKNIHLTFL